MNSSSLKVPSGVLMPVITVNAIILTFGSGFVERSTEFSALATFYRRTLYLDELAYVASL